MSTSGLRIKFRLFSIFVIFIALQGYSQHRLVLLHPTVSNIESMEWMVENKVIDIPGVELLGVYSANEAYDFSESESYIREHHLNNYKLQWMGKLLRGCNIHNLRMLSEFSFIRNPPRCISLKHDLHRFPAPLFPQTNCLSNRIA